MNIFWLVVLLVVNFAISWWNAHQSGKYWTEVKLVGGWLRVLVWAGAAMSAAGFTWVYLTLLGLGVAATGKLNMDDLQVMFDLGFLIIVPVVVTAGFVIWIHSLIAAWQRRTFGSVGIAAWNTYAQARNVFTLASHGGDALGRVLAAFAPCRSGACS